MNICIVSPDFPTSRSIDFIFVEQLCRALCLKVEKINVIAPQSLTKCLVRRVPVARKKYCVVVDSGSIFTVYRPKYITVGNVKGVLSRHNKKSFDRAVCRTLENLKPKPDVIYGHFWQSVRAALPYAVKNKIPLFVASGEESVSQKRIEYTDEEVKIMREYLCGAINVSTNNQRECIEAGLHTRKNSIVIPNSVDNSLFKPISQKECREKLGLKEDDIVVSFVGQLKHRKGPLRLDDALKKLNNPKIKVCFIGKGDQTPTYNNIIFQGSVPHSELPVYLSASDMFVLPTLHEGCCNAIIEALACGLPVISSNLPFNYDILNDKNSIMIDPENVDQIGAAINILAESPDKRQSMSINAIESAQELTLSNRADKIISFIQNSIQQNDNDA